MASFGNPKHLQKTLNVHDNILGLKVNIDSMVRLRGLNKINVHKVHNIQFFDGHSTSCLIVHKTLLKQKKLK
jgi:hypothetical protein